MISNSVLFKKTRLSQKDKESLCQCEVKQHNPWLDELVGWACSMHDTGEMPAVF